MKNLFKGATLFVLLFIAQLPSALPELAYAYVRLGRSRRSAAVAGMRLSWDWQL